jgi:hypothetical protein
MHGLYPLFFVPASTRCHAAWSYGAAVVLSSDAGGAGGCGFILTTSAYICMSGTHEQLSHTNRQCVFNIFGTKPRSHIWCFVLTYLHIREQKKNEHKPCGVLMISMADEHDEHDEVFVGWLSL